MSSPTIVPQLPLPAVVDAALERSRHKLADWTRRLDTHISGLPVAERRPFLIDRLEFFIKHYEKFADKVDRGFEPPPGSMDAFDYCLCIAEINARLAKWEAVQ